MIWVLFICIFLSSNAMAGNHEVEPFIKEVQKYKFTDFKALNETELKKGLSYFGDKATIYEEKELRAKAEEMMQQSTAMSDDQSLPVEERARASSGSAIKSSFARKTKYSNVDEEIWMKKSQLVTENPLIGLDSDCSVSARANDKVEVKYEPYEVEVDSVREVESEEICEEDGSEIHKCYETLNIHVDKQENCNAGIVEYIGASNYADSFKATWDFNYPSLSISLTHDPHPGHYMEVWCCYHQEKIFFNIKDKTQLSSFILNRMDAHGVGALTLNGNNLLHVIHIDKKYLGAKTIEIAALGARNIDLLPYINNGKNEIIFVGTTERMQGERTATLFIEAKQVCSKVVESWTNDCGGL
jgi:hypothetical protein